MAVILLIILAVLAKDIESQEISEFKKSVQPCSIASVAENDHVRCICTHKSIYRCTLKEKSNDTQNYEVNHVPNSNKISCEPNRAYNQGSMTCICNNNGTWPHSQCDEVLKSLPDYLVVKKRHCKPNTYVTVDCNVCRCNDKGKIDSEHCTNNECEPVGKLDRRNSNTENKLFGDCECGNWYSLAPCQFCFCVNSNKLVCNTGTKLMTNRMYLQLGAYNLHICGKKLGKELRELEHNNQDALRQGQDFDKDEPLEPLSTSPKPSTSRKPSTQSTVTPSETVLDVNNKNYIDKESINHENIVADTSTESESEENGLEIKHEIKSYKESTKLPYDEEEYEESEEQTVTGKQDTYYQEKVTSKPENHHLQSVAVPKKVVQLKEYFHEPVRSNNYHDKVVKQPYREDKKEYDDEAEKEELVRPNNYHGEVVKQRYQEEKREYDDEAEKEEPVRPNNYHDEVIKQSYREEKEEFDDEAEKEEPISKSYGLSLPVAGSVKLVSNDDKIQPRQSPNPFSNLAFNMKLDLPKMLDKVFQMALRKSMVSIDPDKKCTPGNVEAFECNTCFCMKNSKMLCTTKKCD